VSLVSLLQDLLGFVTGLALFSGKLERLKT
jgi:hypothetical protein